MPHLGNYQLFFWLALAIAALAAIARGFWLFRAALTGCGLYLEPAKETATADGVITRLDKNLKPPAQLLDRDNKYARSTVVIPSAARNLLFLFLLPVQRLLTQFAQIRNTRRVPHLCALLHANVGLSSTRPATALWAKANETVGKNTGTLVVPPHFYLLSARLRHTLLTM